MKLRFSALGLAEFKSASERLACVAMPLKLAASGWVALRAARCIIKYGNGNKTNKQTNPLKPSRHLAAAAKRGDAARLAELLAKGGAPESFDGSKNALFWSMSCDSAQCCIMLLDAVADPILPST